MGPEDIDHNHVKPVGCDETGQARVREKPGSESGRPSGGSLFA